MKRKGVSEGAVDFDDPHTLKKILFEYKEVLHTELYDNELPFWLAHSLDKECGGYFNNLDEDGKPYDTTKHVWLQCRELWMLSTLYLTSPDLKLEKNSKLRGEVLEAVKHGAAFLEKHARTEDKKRCYFSLNRQGEPVSLQRKLFSECFFVMSFIAYGHVISSADAQKSALDMFENVLSYAKDPTPLGRPKLKGATSFSPLSIPMILLNVIDEIRVHKLADSDSDVKSTSNNELYKKEAEWAIKEILKHVLTEKKMVVENILEDGKHNFETAEGRLLNPGHAIECGWFLLQYNRRYHDPKSDEYKKLQTSALEIIDWSYEQGWDKKNEGITYFLDAEGYTPTQLEWNMKLWWPHNEAIIAFLLSYEVSKDSNHLKKFVQVTDYSLKTFSSTSDSFPSAPKPGSWYGYCDEFGKRTHRFVGGPYKGFFHVPRCLLFSIQLLDNILSSA